MKNAPPTTKPPHLSVVSNANDTAATRLTRAQVAERIGASLSTVRRYEGDRLHPHVAEDGTHWFDPKEVTALAASRANQAIARGSIRNAQPVADARTRGEIAALVFERFEQRQSHAEIVIGLRVEPELVGELFEQYCFGLTERQLRKRDPRVPLVEDIQTVARAELTKRLSTLPDAEPITHGSSSSVASTCQGAAPSTSSRDGTALEAIGSPRTDSILRAFAGSY